jgi:hypothetical protein
MKTVERQGKKSELLTKEEHSALKKLVASYHTVVDAAFAIGVTRQTLDRVVMIGKGSPESINTIRQKLSEPVRA